MKRDSLFLLPTEYQECRFFYFWISSYYPEIENYIVKNVNEGKRSKITGNLLKLIGMKKGLPDYQYIKPNKNWHSLWIEMKTRDKKKHKHDKYQDMWLEKLKKVGHYATYAYGAEDAIKILMDYVKDRI